MVQIFTSAALFLGLLSTACLALPTTNETETTPVPPISSLEERADFNHCGASTFIRNIQSNGPKVADCQYLRDHIPQGEWVLSSGVEVEIQRRGTCAFFVSSPDPGFLGYRVGNTDIRDLINDAINKFQVAGRMTGYGKMKCKSDANSSHQSNVTWSIRI